MVLQNLKDVCVAITKELINTTEHEDTFNKWPEDQVKKAINLYKAKRTKEGIMLQALLDYDFLQIEGPIFMLGNRVIEDSGKWVIK